MPLTPPPPVDLGVIIALKEEFRVFAALVVGGLTPIADGFYHFTVPGPRPARGVVTFLGQMGEVSSGVVTERLLARHRPALLAMLGIAGALHEDVALGDVVAASQVDSFLAGAKAVPDASGAGFELRLSGEVYRPSQAVLAQVSHLEFAHAGLYQRWQEECAASLARLLPAPQIEALRAEHLLNPAPAIAEAHLASGSIVGAALGFQRWLATRDRAYKAIDMESGGLLEAAYRQLHPATQAQTLVLRGISDRADEKKKALDAIGKGGLRQYAMESATRLLFALVAADVLPRGAATPGGRAAAPGPSSAVINADRIEGSTVIAATGPVTIIGGAARGRRS